MASSDVGAMMNTPQDQVSDVSDGHPPSMTASDIDLWITNGGRPSGNKEFEARENEDMEAAEADSRAREAMEAAAKTRKKVKAKRSKEASEANRQKGGESKGGE